MYKFKMEHFSLKDCYVRFPNQTDFFQKISSVGENLLYRGFILGTAVTKNLLRKGFNVAAITDIKPELCQGYPESIQVVLWNFKNSFRLQSMLEQRIKE
jgi:hypothetical protein